jgi:hypothetical protein
MQLAECTMIIEPWCMTTSRPAHAMIDAADAAKPKTSTVTGPEWSRSAW